MTSTLLRPCLDCGRSVRGKPRCHDRQAKRDHAKRKRRPDLDQRAERRRRERVVADHRATIGDWCPGWDGAPAHPSADLTADHVIEVAAGAAASGPLVVRCRSCNAARSANVRSQLLGEPVPPMESTLPTPRQPKFPTHSAPEPPPVVA
jgi:5-methylcytosine-specific restriction enzyme A